MPAGSGTLVHRLLEHDALGLDQPALKRLAARLIVGGDRLTSTTAPRWSALLWMSLGKWPRTRTWRPA